MTETNVSILGTDWRIVYCSEKEDKCLDGMDGYTDETVKKCVVENYESYREETTSKQELDVQMKKVARHEIIHAFLFESGLAENSAWAQNEEMVDWIAIQFPKLAKAFIEAGAL